MNRRRFLIGAGAVAAAAAVPAAPVIAKPETYVWIETTSAEAWAARDYVRYAFEFVLGPGVDMPLGAQVFVNDVEFAVDEIIYEPHQTLIKASEVLKPDRFEVRGSLKWIDPEDAAW